jgi:hypothetical protein
MCLWAGRLVDGTFVDHAFGMFLSAGRLLDGSFIDQASTMVRLPVE